jgi:nicotinate-nucleotide pyrophosphorylase (carboxylating)
MASKLDMFYQNIDTQLIDLALCEDLGLDWVDYTNRCLFPASQAEGVAELISKHDRSVVICGLTLISKIFQQLGCECRIETQYADGDWVPAYSTIARIHANATHLLTAERTVLNFIRHLSAIATLTAQYVEKVKHTTMKILDTRKTTPGMRHLEKYAVQCGGGVNHRWGLYDAIMVKDTHIDLLGGMQNMLHKLQHADIAGKPVIIEIRNRDELQQVLEQHKVPVDRVLLDNMTMSELYYCVERAKLYKMPTEASGNICLDNIVAIAETGVDYASVGRLTHSAGQVDLAIKI